MNLQVGDVGQMLVLIPAFKRRHDTEVNYPFYDKKEYEKAAIIEPAMGG